MHIASPDSAARGRTTGERSLAGDGATPGAIRLVYCGADADWDNGTLHEIRRRHLFFLRSFVADPEIGHVYVLQRVSRLALFRQWWSGRWRERYRDRPKATAVFVARWLPERPWLPWTAAWNRAFARWLVRRQLGPSPSITVVWCYALRGMALADYLDLEGEWFVDTDHDILNDPNRRSLRLREAEALLLRCAHRTRCVFSGSRSMLDWLRKNGVKRLQHLRNGVLPERFDRLAPERPAVASRVRPVLGYVGVLSPWIDFELLKDLAARRPDWRFVLAGPWYRMPPLAQLERLGNIDFTGPVAGSQVPRLLTSFHVGLGLYRRETWLDVDSMKLYEYLAAGLPTVSTPFHPMLSGDFEELVTIAEDTVSFEAEVDRILGWSDAERQRFQIRCHDFVTRHSWDVRTREVLDALKSSIPGNAEPLDLSPKGEVPAHG